MPLEGRSSPEGANGREDWLAAAEWGRLRPWAYEEILFGTREERARTAELAAVVGELEGSASSWPHCTRRSISTSRGSRSWSEGSTS